MELKEYYITGTIYEADEVPVTELMRTVFGDIDIRDKTFSYDILFEKENIRFFLATYIPGDRSWDVNGEFTGEEQELNDLLSRITELLIKADFNYDIGYVLMNEAADEIGEEVNFYHPDFDKRYKEYLNSPPKPPASTP